jgi:hypothetical protein
MSLPSGLIFFLDFQYSGDGRGGLGGADPDSLFGGGVVGSQITGGVDLTGVNAEKSFYNLNNGYSSATGSLGTVTLTTIASGTIGSGLSVTLGSVTTTLEKLCRFDPDFISGTTKVALFTVPVSSLDQLNRSDLVAISASLPSGSLVRRLTAKCDSNGADATGDVFSHVRLVVASDTLASTALDDNAGSRLLSWPQDDDITNASALGAVKGTATWALENQGDLPEIDVKIDSVAVTAKTKKLKVKWTPELGQDLNAYHNLDAEVELTSIMSEQIALELDREILEDLIKGATAATFYWSRRPGKFLDRSTGLAISTSANEALLGADFTGNVSQWYETLLETVNDVSAQIHRKTLRGGANFLVCGPEVASVLEMTAGFRAKVAPDDDAGMAGAVNVGSVSKKWDVYVDPYFPRNVILVGRRGAQFLESGYVYAPYVPLQVTPTIFGVEDFVPRKGVMTRYAKKMVRPDMYGLVVIQDMLG